MMSSTERRLLMGLAKGQPQAATLRIIKAVVTLEFHVDK